MTARAKDPDDPGSFQSPDIHQLARMLGAAILSDAKHRVWEDVAFCDWWFEESRERPHPRRRSTDADARQRGQSFMLRALANAHRVQRHSGDPRWMTPRVDGRVAEVLRPAAVDRAAPLVDLGVAAGSGRELWDELVDRWLEVPRGLPAAAYVALRIVGDSMEPLMHTGDTVLVRLGAEVAVGAIVVARKPEEGYVCKRVRAVQKRRVELASLDPGRPVINIPHDQSLIVGTVVAIWCPHDNG
jgi:SOS-response transcriptional repressor LexA